MNYQNIRSIIAVIIILLTVITSLFVFNNILSSAYASNINNQNPKN